MTDDPNRCFGKPEGIEKRLAMWVTRFSTDRSIPWVGMGVVDDLKCACRMLGGDPDKKYPDMRKNPPSAPAPVPTVEYDL